MATGLGGTVQHPRNLLSLCAAQERLRVLVAGGDGTVAWVMAIIKELDLKPVPPIAIIPLGTGEGC